jgi:hypothetical protein
MLGIAVPWLEWCRDAGAWTCGLMALGLLRDARQMRKFWLADLTRSTDLYLRSPAFLDLMRRGLGALNTSTRPSSSIPPR